MNHKNNIFAPKGTWFNDFLSLDNSKRLLGVCAILIILHHISQLLGENAGILSVFINAGVCFVGLFFFFSGYGLFHSLIKKENYLDGFLKKRFVSILIPLYTTTFIFILFSLIAGSPIDLPLFIGYLSIWVPINPHMWYIVEIAIFYLAFYFIFKGCKSHTAGLYFMLLFVSFVICGSFLLGHGDYWFQGEWWYNASLLFVLGMFMAKYEGQMISFIKKAYIPLLVAVTFLTAGLYILTSYFLMVYSYWSETSTSMAYDDKLRCLSVQLPMIICFCTLILILNLIIIFGYIMEITNPILLTLLIIGFSIFSSCPLHFLNQCILKKLLRL